MNTTIKSLIAIVIADIDIFLLQTEDQKTDNDKEFYTKSEIREQLSKTMIKTVNVMNKVGFDVDKPLEIDN